MPSEQMSEPTTEQLSAYLDHELDASAQRTVGEHVATCSACQARLDGLRQTANAIRALPMESPPRTLTIPVQPERRRWSWAPAGWAGSAAVATLIVVFGVSHLHLPAGSSATGAGSSQNGGAGATALEARAPGAQYQANKGTAGDQARALDQQNGGRMIIASTDSAAYSSTGTMTVRILYYGFVPSEAPPATLLLERNGYAVQLPAPSESSGQAGGIQGEYQLGSLPLPNPKAGTYTLTVIQLLPGNSGATLVAHLTITVSG